MLTTEWNGADDCAQLLANLDGVGRLHMELLSFLDLYFCLSYLGYSFLDGDLPSWWRIFY